MTDAEPEAMIAALLKEGRHDEAAAICLERGEAERAGELFAAIWAYDRAIEVTESAGLYEAAYRYAVAAKDHGARRRILERLEAHPEQAARAAAHADARSHTIDAARLFEAAGEVEAAAERYERAGELTEAARCRLDLGQHREAGMLFERRVREDPDDGDAALALGRILARFGRYEHAVRALQQAAERPEHERAALRQLVACFHAMGLEDAANDRLDRLRRIEPGLPITVDAFLEEVFGDARGLGAAGEGDDARLLAGRYRVVRTLGAGATGRVVLAHDAFYGREVAVKVLHVGSGAGGRDAFARFAREARVAAGISHPNVVQVFDFVADGPFLVMELMGGGTLEERLSPPGAPPCPLGAAETRHVARGVLSALEAVHRRGVVHRDLKPENIFFGESGDVKLGDFGVAHLTDLGATLTGAFMGTLAYMAPEQITGDVRPDASTDLYAFGVILFRCLTGRLPFEGPDFVAAHLEQTPPRASEVAPWLGEGFDDVLLSLLQKEQSARPSSAAELYEQLDALPFDAIERPEYEPELAAPRISSVPPDPAGTVRYLPEGPGPFGTIRARDTLLDRHVLLVPIEPGPRAARLKALARADGPFLQAIYDIDEAEGRAVIEDPEGTPLERLAPDDPRRRAVGPAIASALTRLHAERVVHGFVDPSHVLVGPGRVCLRLPFELPSAPSFEADLAAAAAL